VIIDPGALGKQSPAYSSAVKWTAEEIRSRRRAKDWSQDDLAQALGVHKRSVTNWESGASKPQAGNIDALEHALGDAPVPEVTLSGASNLQFVSELARRLEAGGLDDSLRLPEGDIGWPQRKLTRRSRNA